MAMARNSPYVWVTWLTKILAGEQSCEWASWFKAHYQDFEKLLPVLLRRAAVEVNT